MNELILPVKPGVLPSGFCPADYQDLLNTFSSKQSVEFPATLQGVTVSGNKPTDITKAWLQLDTLGRPVRFYYFAQGAWLSLHPDVTGKAIIWTGALPDFTTFDGGDAGPAGPTSGPMWQEVTELRARFPLGAGTLPSGVVITNGSTGGEEKHILTAQEMPPHTHPTSKTPINIGLGAQNFLNPPGEPGSGTGGLTGSAGGDPGTGTPPTAAAGHNNLPPFYGVYFLRRTNRLFYAVT